MARDFTGSSIWARGIHCRAPISACPARSRTYARWTVLIPLATPARAAQVLPLHAGRGTALLLLACLIQRADHQAAPPPGAGPPPHPARPPRTGGLRPRRGGVPRGPAEQPLRLVWRLVTRMLSDRPAVAPVSPLASALRYFLPAATARAGRNRAAAGPHLPAFPGGQARPYPGSRSRLRFCSPHTPHDREAAALRIHSRAPPTRVIPGLAPNGCCRTRGRCLPVTVAALASGPPALPGVAARSAPKSPGPPAGPRAFTDRGPGAWARALRRWCQCGAGAGRVAPPQAPGCAVARPCAPAARCYVT